MKLYLAARGDAVPAAPADAVEQSWHYPDGSLAVVCAESAAELRVAIPGTGVVRMMRDTGEVVGYPDADASAEELGVAFREQVEPRLHAARGACALHAGAVAAGPACVALLGESRAGKSSLAYAWAVRRERVLVADDALVLAERDDGYRVLPLEFEAKLRAPVSDAVDGVPERHAQTGGDVRLLALVLVSPVRERGARPELDRLSAREAFPLVIGRAYSFQLQSAEARRVFFSGHLRLLRGVAAYRLSYPHDLAQLDPTIELLDAVLRERAGAGQSG